jgi:replicative DNA helicase
MGEALHSQAWAAIGKLIGKGKRADASSIVSQINAAAPMADMTTLDYLEKLKFEALEKPSDLASFADAVIDAWRGRELTAVMAKYDAAVKRGAPGLIEDLHNELNRIAGDNRPETYGFVTDAIDGVMAGIRERRKRGGGISGIATGFPKLDEILDGLRPQTLTMIGARPKQGKTAILLCIIRNLCKRGLTVVFFSLEMPKDQIIQRLIAMEAGIDYSRVVRGRYDDDEEKTIDDAAIEVDRWRLIIDDAGSLTPSSLVLRARNAVFADKADVVFIDYIQRISPEKGSKRYEEVTAISMAIADMRKVIKVPIVCAAQLNRKLGDRSDKIDFKKFCPESTRPTDGDLRDSGQLEQDADALLFINRPIVMLELMQPTEEASIPDWEAACNKWRTKAEIIVHFNRAGAGSKIVDFRFSGHVMRFDEAL